MGLHLLLGLHTASIPAYCKTNAEGYFHFSYFFVKVKILLGFFLLVKRGTSVDLLLKTKWHNWNFQKAGDTYIV